MTAAGALLHAGITSLPVDLFRVAEHFSVKVVDYAACADIYDITAEELYRTVSTQGFSFMDDGQFICAINAAACGKMRKRFTLAHELSHIHISLNQLRQRAISTLLNKANSTNIQFKQLLANNQRLKSKRTKLKRLKRKENLSVKQNLRYSLRRLALE